VSAVGPPGLDVVDRLISLTKAGDRSDLVQRLAHTRRRLLDPAVRVLVVGEFKQGKSQLINALVDAPVCPVDDDIATALPTEVSYAKIPIASLVRGIDDASDAETTRLQVPLRLTGKICCVPRSASRVRSWLTG
jgi:ribosome biogenesis GTPase A